MLLVLHKICNLLNFWEDNQLRVTNENTRVALNNIILQGFVRDLLAFGPNYPIREKFELHFLAAIDNLIRNMLENIVPGAKRFKIEAAAKWYSKNIRETPLDRALANAQKYLRDNALIATCFDKGVGFCIMKKRRAQKK